MRNSLRVRGQRWEVSGRVLLFELEEESFLLVEKIGREEVVKVARRRRRGRGRRRSAASGDRH